MYYREISRFFGIFLLGFSIVFFIPLFVSLYYQFLEEPYFLLNKNASQGFVHTIFVCSILGACFWMAGIDAKGSLYRREGFVLVLLIWFLTPLIACLPFIFSGVLQNPVQGYFEMVSGFTTTGATILEPKIYNAAGAEIPIIKNICGMHEITYSYYGTVKPFLNPLTGKLIEGIEAVPKGLLFWRSLTQWLGGMGIVILFIAIFPILGVGVKTLFNAESTGPVKSSFAPRMKETAAHLWKIYFGLTFLEVFLLFFLADGVSLFDAITISFSTLSTGGLSVRNASIGSYNSPVVEWIVMIFMVLGGINFSLYFYALRGKLYKFFDREFLCYMLLIVLSAVIGGYLLVGSPKVFLGGGPVETFRVGDAFRYAAFQLVSAQTSTGFATIDYDVWPYSLELIMWLLMFIGGMAGSTAGGFKVIRLLMIFKIIQNKIESFFRPSAIRPFYVGEKEVDEGIANTVLCFFFATVMVSLFGVMGYIFNGVDIETSVGLVSCMINNVGLAFRMAGPTASCAFLSNTDLLISSFLMLIGRLEFFAVLVVFVPAFWRKYS